MINVTFVCMGNICRSPGAEAVMNKIVEAADLSDQITCDSAGTIAYHEGEKADSRMQRHARNRGYNLTSIARKFRYNDFEKADYIVAMDNANFVDILALDKESSFIPKISKMASYFNTYEDDEVPDPYYGGPESFEHVFDLLEDGCAGLLEKIKADHPEIME